MPKIEPGSDPENRLASGERDHSSFGRQKMVHPRLGTTTLADGDGSLYTVTRRGNLFHSHGALCAVPPQRRWLLARLVRPGFHPPSLHSGSPLGSIPTVRLGRGAMLPLISIRPAHRRTQCRFGGVVSERARFEPRFAVKAFQDHSSPVTTFDPESLVERSGSPAFAVSIGHHIPNRNNNQPYAQVEFTAHYLRVSHRPLC